jgi:hypothetical protein
VREALAAERAGAASPADLLRAELASRAERAHGRAVREAEELVTAATRLAKCLSEGGIGAVFSGNGFMSDALSLRDALVALEGAREAFGAAVRAKEMEAEAR